MNTTGKFNRGRNNGTAKCIDCGKLVQRGNIACITEANGRDGMCEKCFEKAGQQNCVSDGIITCVQFQAMYNGEHSEYCDCVAAPVAKGRYVLTAADRAKGGRVAAAKLAKAALAAERARSRAAARAIGRQHIGIEA